MRRRQIQHAGDETVGMVMQALVVAILQHIAPRLLDRPSQLLAKQLLPELRQLGLDQRCGIAAGNA
jgi:hypothetical protein